MRLLFVETDVFSARIRRFGLESLLQALQAHLLEAPDSGKLDPGTGGLRKIRVPDPDRSKGKRGGARVHYLWLPRWQRIYLIYVYSKDDTATLNAVQMRALQRIVQAIKLTLEETDT